MDSEKVAIAPEFATVETFFGTMIDVPPDSLDPQSEEPTSTRKDNGSASAELNSQLSAPKKLQSKPSSFMPRSLTFQTPSAGVAKGRTSAPQVAEVGYGSYLIFSKDEDLFYLQWSETSIPGALAWCSPSATVPKFKFKVNGGRQALFQNFSKDKQAYFRAWCQFIKISNEFQSKVMILEGVDDESLPPLKLFALEVGVQSKGSGELENKVYELDRLLLHDLKIVKSVIAVSDTCVAVKEGSSMSAEFFEKVGSNDGGSARLV